MSAKKILSDSKLIERLKMASLVTLYIANILERGIIEIEIQDRLPSSEEQITFFKVKIGDKISNFMLYIPFSNRLLCTGYLSKRFSK